MQTATKPKKRIKKREQGDVAHLRLALRLLWFWMRVLIGVAVAGALILTCFYMAMDMANIYILTSEGMARRAAVVVGTEEKSELAKYFSSTAINADDLLKSGIYKDYVVRSIEYDPQFEWFTVWPWEDEAKVTMIERVLSIDGELPNEKKSEAQMAIAGKIPPPEWENVKYEITVRRINGVWRIDGLEKLQVVRDPSPTPSRTPKPSGSAEPSIAPNGTALPQGTSDVITAP